MGQSPLVLVCNNSDSGHTKFDQMRILGWSWHCKTVYYSHLHSCNTVPGDIFRTLLSSCSLCPSHPWYHGWKFSGLFLNWPGRVAQSVTYLATDVCLTADPGARVIMKWFLRSFSSFRWFIQEGLLSVTSERMCRNYWLTACSSLPRKKCG